MGAGATINVPLPWHSGHAAAQRVFEAVVTPAARRFRPDMILVSTGDPFATCLPLGTFLQHHASPAGMGLAGWQAGSRPPAYQCPLLPSLPLLLHPLPPISAGYDAHWQDPLEHLQWQSATFHWLTAAVRRLAEELCGGRLLLLLEGG